VTIKYLDRDANFEPGAQGAERINTQANRETVVEVNVSLDADEAAQAAHVLLYNEHASNQLLNIRLTEQYQRLVPADVITITDDDDSVLVRITEESENTRGVIEYTAVPEYAPIYTQSLDGSPGSTDYAAAVDQNGPAALAWLDIPILNDSDDDLGVYAGASGYLASWGGHDLFKFAPEASTYNRIFSFIDSASIGITEGTLGDPASGVVDYDNTVTIALADHAIALSSSTAAAVLIDGSVNRAVIGRPGQYEVIQFITAASLGDGRYTLSGLLRARRGTGYATGSHASGDEFALLDPAAIVRLRYALSDVDLTVLHKFAGLDEGIDLVGPLGLDYSGVAKLPFSPALLEAVQSGADWVVDWIPRSRLNGAIWSSQASVTDPEITEYTLDFLDGSDVVKGSYTVTVGTETRTYDSGEQTTDFGSPQSDIIAVLYQRGLTLDREGHGLRLDTSTGALTIVDPKV
jgi:hypothetical protein